MIILAFLLGAIFGAVVMVHLYAIVLKWQFKELGIPTYRDRDGCKYRMIRLEKKSSYNV